jgi:cytochrome c oxidase subunit 2
MINKRIWMDAAEPWQVGYQDPATPGMEGIIDLYNSVNYYLIIVIVLVTWMLIAAILHFTNIKISHKYFNHGTILEIIWTVLPALVLVIIAFPSFKLLYFLDEVIDPAITIKVIGRQWYWQYEYSDYAKSDEETVAFDSYMIPTDDLKEGELRLLEVDNRVVLPVNTHVRVIMTSGDVIHSWAIPSLGVKMDAYPGRLNQTSFLIKREGIYYGQCSELCGVNHGFMPIAIEAVSLDKYVSWIGSQLEE